MKLLILVLGIFIPFSQVVFAQVIDVEGNEYKTIIIGEQEWMAENLNTSLYQNGTEIQEAQTPLEWLDSSNGEKAAWAYYENDTSYAKNYGKLYNWYVVKNSSNVCPTGWRVPSRKDWKILNEFLDSKKEGGDKLKSDFEWANNGGGSNSTGFSANPGGQRRDTGEFGYVGELGKWWSSSVSNAYTASSRMLQSGSPMFNKGSEYYGYGYSVRCLKK